ncbi:MAG: adenylylsulfate kinase-like enzyme [Bacillariaceae sp.]|jgi:adenylylsulfate kinase-like enzyme
MVSVAASTVASSAFVIDKRWLILLLRKTNVSSSSSICILSLAAMISTIVLLSYQPMSTPITIFDVDNAAKNFTTTTAKLSSHAHDNLDHHHHPYAQNQKEQYNRHSSSDHDYNYDWNLSTEENYSRSSISGNVNDNANDGNGHYFQYDYLYHGDFRTNRKRLDRSYHTNYIRERQILQDTIIKSFLIDVKQQQQQYNDGQGDMLVQQQQQQQLSATIISRSEREECTNIIPDMSSSSSSSLIFDNKYNHQQQHTHQHQHTQSQSSPSPPPWIIFTAGVYGAGKSHTIKRLQRNGCFPSNKSFVTVDPDEIRQLLPEFSTYIEKTPLLAGEYTQKESGMIAELLTDTALSNNFNVLVDGSLKDSFWYEEYFTILRRLYPKIQIGIIYVTAPLDEIYDRVKKRSVITGRSIPMGTLQQSIEDVPKSVKKLQSSVDFFFEIHNDSQQQKQQ